MYLIFFLQFLKFLSITVLNIGAQKLNIGYYTYKVYILVYVQLFIFLIS